MAAAVIDYPALTPGLGQVSLCVNVEAVLVSLLFP